MRRDVLLTLAVLAAGCLTLWQLGMGVRTDEAKYLLNIPYPHPPLVRTALAALDGWAGQEAFVRLAFALLLVGTGFAVLQPRTWEACLAWLTLPAVLLQAGSVMMAPLVAVQTLVLLALLRGERQDPGVVGLLWLGIVLTSYQGLLLFPLVAALLLRAPGGRLARFAAFMLPIAAVGLYTASHPLSAASFVLQAGKDADLTMLERAGRVLRLWVAGMGIAGVPTVAWALLYRRSVPVVATFLLFSAYGFVGSFPYYAIFFAPFVPWALGSVPDRMRRAVCVALMVTGPLTAVLLGGGREGGSHARAVVRETFAAAPTPVTAVFMAGSFGHEWQYESPVPVGRYAPAMAAPPGSVLICPAACDVPEEGWVRLPVAVGGASVWQRRQTL